jgi:CBS-domain-containing membrane protein
MPHRLHNLNLLLFTFLTFIILTANINSQIVHLNKYRYQFKPIKHNLMIMRSQAIKYNNCQLLMSLLKYIKRNIKKIVNSILNVK